MKNLEEKHFIVGEVFNYRNKESIPLYFGYDFKNSILESALLKVVEVNSFGKNILKDHPLPKGMHDKVIQDTQNSTPMEEDQFWLTLYLLIIKPELGKKVLDYELQKDKVYILHLKLFSGFAFAIIINYSNNKWNINSHVFNFGMPWSEGVIFLYPVAI